MTTTTYRPFIAQVRDAKRGAQVSTDWVVPAGWPDDMDTFTGASRRLLLIVTKRTRAGTTGRINWWLVELTGERPGDYVDVERSHGTFDDLRAAMHARRLAV